MHIKAGEKYYLVLKTKVTDNHFRKGIVAAHRSGQGCNAVYKLLGVFLCTGRVYSQVGNIFQGVASSRTLQISVGMLIIMYCSWLARRMAYFFLLVHKRWTCFII